MPTNTRILATDYVTVQLRTDDIIFMDFPENNSVIELNQSQKILELRNQINSKAKKQLLLVSLLNNPRPTKEARDIAKSEQMIEITSGMAMIVDNMINRFLGNLFIAMNKGEYPVRLFKNESQATVWLRSLKN